VRTLGRERASRTAIPKMTRRERALSGLLRFSSLGWQASSKDCGAYLSSTAGCNYLHIRWQTGNRVQKSCKSASDLAGGALAASTLQQALAGGVLVAWGNLEQRELILVAVA